MTDTNVTVAPKPSKKARILTKTNIKRGAIVGAVVLVAVLLKSKLNGTASVNADIHVDNDDSKDN